LTFHVFRVLWLSVLYDLRWAAEPLYLAIELLYEPIAHTLPDSLPDCRTDYYVYGDNGARRSPLSTSFISLFEQANFAASHFPSICCFGGNNKARRRR
jgi:hypothetical protein